MSQKITDNQIRLTAAACGLSHRLTGYLGVYCRLVAGAVAAVPRLAKIAEAFRVCERQARRIMNDLAASGAIGIARRFMIVCGRAVQLSNRYSVNLSPVAAALSKGVARAKALWRASCPVVIKKEPALADIFGRPIASLGTRIEAVDNTRLPVPRDMQPKDENKSAIERFRERREQRRQ